MPPRLLAVPPLLALLACAAPALAQPATVLAPAKDGRLDNLVPVPAPFARSAALSEPLGLLAFCHDREYPDAHVSLVRLDARGNPAAYATTWKLPRPAGLDPKVPTYAVAAAFHPKLPLLYVWHDIALPYTNPPQKEPPALRLFDHLLVYNIAKGTPELLVALCRHPHFLYGHQGGALAVDAAGEFLYVPNGRDPKNPGSYRFGRFRLDSDGLPAPDEKGAKQPVAARVKHLAELNAADKLLPQFTPIEYVYLFPGNPAGSGQSFLPLGRDVVLSSGWGTVISWRPEDRAATLHGLPLKVVGHTLLAAHPRLPLLYAAPGPSDSVFRVWQVGGWLSLLPHQYVLPGARLSSPPAVLAGGGKLAVGGAYQVYVAGLDDKGGLLPEVARVRVLCPQVRALAYSPRFDKLYVGVEVSK